MYALILLQVFVWTLAPFFCNQSPPLDVVENFTLSEHWVVAFYKQPNLPTLLIDIFNSIFYSGAFAAYFIAQLCIGLTYYGVYLLSKEFFDEPRAVISSLLLSGIYYFTWPSYEFNDNVVQMPLWVYVIYFSWKSVETNKTQWWIILGIVANLSLWAKYSSLVLLAILFSWFLLDAKARSTFRSIGPWLSILVFFIALSPQIQYLIQTDYLPFHYAISRAENPNIGGALSFFYAQLADLIGFFIILFFSGLLRFGARTSLKTYEFTAHRRAGIFLVTLGVGPIVLTMIISFLGGIGLKSMWGSPMLSMIGVIFIFYFSGKYNVIALRRIFISAITIMMLTGTAYLGVYFYKSANYIKPDRLHWPQMKISNYFQDAFHNHTGLPLQMIVGDYWLAGLLAMGPSREKMSVLIDGDMQKSPWIMEDNLKSKGFLIVWNEDEEISQSIKVFAIKQGVNIAEKQKATFTWTNSPKGLPIEINFIIVPPSH